MVDQLILEVDLMHRRRLYDGTISISAKFYERV